jgi:hypothetical protein
MFDPLHLGRGFKGVRGNDWAQRGYISVLKKSCFALTAQNPIGFKRFYVGTGCDVFKAARAAIRLGTGLLRLKDKGLISFFYQK